MIDRVRRGLIGLLAAQGVLRALERARIPAQRDNFRGRTVSLLAGPALALAVASTARSPRRGAVAVLGAAAAGSYDDAVGARDGAKGLGGHLAALASGRLTAGGVKLVGIPAAALLAARRPRARAIDVALDAGVIAGAANLLNLLDLRPGRALKVGVLAGLALDEPGIVGSCAAVLPSDLAERTMLGDAGANALGAALGVALVSRVPSRIGRLTALAGLVGLTGASERVSFSAVIDANPLLRRLDQLGRTP